MTDVEERIDRLEQLIADFVTNVGIEFNKLYNSQMRTEAELPRVQGGEPTGTLSKDLVAPSLPRVIREVFGLEVADLMPRRKTRLPDGRRKEFDAIGFAGDLIFLTSVKSTLRSADIERFVTEIQEFREFFPEYAPRKVVGHRGQPVRGPERRRLRREDRLPGARRGRAAHGDPE
jgi:hypothetical protein